MILTRTITAAYGDSSTTVHSEAWKMTRGFVYQFGIYFPPGSGGLLKVRLKDYSRQLWPLDSGEWFFGDDVSFSWPESHNIADEPFELLIDYRNEDEIYDHAVQIQIGFVTEEIFVGRFLPSVGAEQIAEILNRYKEAESVLAEQLKAQRLTEAKSVLGID